MDWMEAEGKSYGEAVEALLLSLGADRSEVEIEELGQKRKLFGLGEKVYRVRGRLKKEAVDGKKQEDVSLETLSREIAKIGADLSETGAESKAFLEKILDGMGIRGAGVRAVESGASLMLEITSGAGGRIIGRKGETLEALQTIVEIFATRHKGARYEVIVDTEGYRSRQQSRLVDLAKEMAKKAVAKKSRVALKPMSAAERKVVHAALQEDSLVETRSEGTGESRRVVIFPVK